MGNFCDCADSRRGSKYGKLLSTCKIKGVKFSDYEFSPNKLSLIKNWDEDHPDILEIVDEWD